MGGRWAGHVSRGSGSGRAEFGALGRRCAQWCGTAREFTERWGAQPADSQGCSAWRARAGRVTAAGGAHVHLEVPASVPESAQVDTTIALEISGIGRWTLTGTRPTGPSIRGGPGTSRDLADRRETAWRLLTGARYDGRQVELFGHPALTWPCSRCAASSSSFHSRPGPEAPTRTGISSVVEVTDLP